MKIDPEIVDLIKRALREDLNKHRDLTTDALISSNRDGEAVIIAKQTGIIAGLGVASRVFRELDADTVTTAMVTDGERVDASTQIMKVKGKLSSILTAERTALNFLQRLSGIATLTAEFVEKVKGTPARILDTRKTTPGFRSLEKYAVRAGGGMNHRFGLYDMVLIKENHITAAGGIAKAVDCISKELREKNLQLRIEVETKTVAEVKEAADLAVDRIMLDNMTVAQIKAAVELVKGRVELEASGGVNLKSIREIAEAGVDFISVGALTHSAPAFDMSLLIG